MAVGKDMTTKDKNDTNKKNRLSDESVYSCKQANKKKIFL
jgi:hypothetical protein